MNIPKIVHQFWIGVEPLPPQCRIWHEDLQRMNPDWEVWLWGADRPLPKEVAQDPVYAAGIAAGCYPAHLTDRLRILALHRFGGFYTDIDAMPVRSLEPILDLAARHPGGQLIAARNPRGVFDVAGLAAPPKSPLVGDLISGFGDCHLMGRHMGEYLFAYHPLPALVEAPMAWWYGDSITEETLLYQRPVRLHSWKESHPADPPRGCVLARRRDNGAWEVAGCGTKRSEFAQILAGIDQSRYSEAGIIEDAKHVLSKRRDWR